MTQHESAHHLRHRFLVRLWQEENQLWSVLTPTEQYDLLSFFCPHDPLKPGLFIGHTRRLLMKDPDLETRAMAALEVLTLTHLTATDLAGEQKTIYRQVINRVSERVDKLPVSTGTPVSSTSGHRIRITAVMRPTLDHDKFADALLRLQSRIEKEEREAGQADQAA